MTGMVEQSLSSSPLEVSTGETAWESEAGLRGRTRQAGWPSFHPELTMRATLARESVDCTPGICAIRHSKSSIACLDQPDSVAYLIADDSFFERPLFGWQELVDAWDDVASMERNLGMPEGSLQQTIATYNEYAQTGEDLDFHKSKKWMKPLENPPYAALDLRLGHAHYVGFPLGGLRVTIDGEVLRGDGRVIEGLFAAGGCASNIAQDGAGYSSGTCIGESTFFGRRAGEKAASGG